jgi:hypothetical protein
MVKEASAEVVAEVAVPALAVVALVEASAEVVLVVLLMVAVAMALVVVSLKVRKMLAALAMGTYIVVVEEAQPLKEEVAVNNN